MIKDTPIRDFDMPTEGQPEHTLLDHIEDIIQVFKERWTKGLPVGTVPHFLFYGTQEQAATMDEMDILAHSSFLGWFPSSEDEA